MTFYRISYPRNLPGSLHPHPLCGIVFELSVLDDKINRIDWKRKATDGVITKAPLGGKKLKAESHRQK